jgi:hypothetical protein
MFCFNSGSNLTRSGRDIRRGSWQKSFFRLTESHFALPKSDLNKFILNFYWNASYRRRLGECFASIPDQIRPHPAEISAVEVGRNSR